ISLLPGAFVGSLREYMQGFIHKRDAMGPPSEKQTRSATCMNHDEAWAICTE
ncbi:hypothetical protein CU097_002064, partial [Rhizopus azygosporus]